MEQFELSPQQRRAWLLDPVADAVCRVAVTGVGDVTGPGDLTGRVFAAARRHEVWHTRLVHVPGRTVPVQEVGPTLAATLRVSVAEPRPGEQPAETVVELRAPRALADAQSLWLLALEALGPHDGLLPGPPATQFAGWQLQLAEESVAPRGLTLAETAAAQVTGPVGDAAVDGADLGDVARASGVPPVDALLAVWRALISRLTGLSAPTLGVLDDGRWFEALASCHGRLATLTADATSVGDRPVVDLVGTAPGEEREFALGYEELLDKDRQLRFTFSVIDPGAPPPGGLRIVDLHDDEPAALGLTGWWHADTGRLRITGHCAADAAERLRTALAHAARKPDVRACDLDITLAAEARPRPNAAPTERSLVALIARAAQATPDAIAVADDREQVSFAHLLRRAAALATTLDVCAEDRVGVLLDRSAALLVAITATWVAGAATVTVDPRWPPARIASLFEATGVRTVVTSDGLSRLLPEGRWRLVDVGRPQLVDAGRARPADAGSAGGARTPPTVDHRQLAIVIVTSGTTSAPKAVEVEHRNLASYITQFLRRHDPGRASWGLASSLSADLGLTAALGSLVSGGRLQVLDWAQSVDPDAYALACRRAGIEAVKLTPTHQRALLAAADAAGALPQRLLVSGGDVLPVDLVSRVRALAPALEILNHYGPTETAVGVLTERVGATEPTLGRPLGHASLRVLDERGRPVPGGRAGELAIGGGGVARGYHRRPGLTADRFRPDPGGSGTRAYLTGDLVAAGPAGARFLGRSDEQVKIHGYRVDPEEVAAALRTLEDVSDAAVRVLADGPERSLHAWVRLAPHRMGPRLEAEQQALIEHWSTVFAATHAGLKVDPEHLTSTHGWTSSYSGENLTEAEVRERVEDIRAVLLERPCGRVLEIGCGTGLIALTAAESCEHYTGTDVVNDLLRYTADLLRTAGTIDVEQRVQLLCRPAHDLSGFAPEAFDTVVLNSVVQYFPSIEYLVDLIGRLIPTVRPGGRILVADVRDLRLLDGFHLSTELFGEPGTASARTIRDRAARARSLDAELAVDTTLFSSLPLRVPGIAAVDVEVPRGRARNELNDFRYRAVIHIGAPQPSQPLVWSRWAGPQQLRAAFAGAADAVAVRAVPDVRSAGACAIAHDSVDAGDASQLRAIVASAEQEAVHPDDVRAWARAAGREVQVRPGEPGTVDVIATRRAAPGGHVPAEAAELAAIPLPRLATAPALSNLARAAIPEIRAALAARLPTHLVPATISVVPAFPLRDNGKIDTNALPAPVRGADGRGAYRPPRDPLEARIAAIFADVLGVDQVGVDEDFFALGGHSLLAIQVLSRVRKAVRVDLPLRVFFASATTVAAIANVARAGPAADLTGPAAPPRSGFELVARPDNDRPEPAPVSFAQQRILDSSDPGHPVYNIPFAFVIEGELDIGVLRASIEAIMTRHGAWRARFAHGPDGWSSATAPDATFDLDVIDLSERPQGQQTAAASRIVTQIAQERLDLGSQIARGCLMRLGERRTALALVVHHVVSDGWSTNLWSHEFSELYTAHVLGRPPRLPELPVQFADHARWERGWLRGDALHAELGHWRRRLGGAPRELDLPVDRDRPPAQTYRGDGLAFGVPAALVDRLRRVAHAHNATLFMAALTAWHVLLHLWTGDDDVTVGTPVAHRNRVELEPLLGCFVNFVLVPARVEPSATLGDLLRQVRETSVWAFEHQDAPFCELVRELAPGDDQRPPLFSVMLELANAPGGSRLTLPGLSLSELRFEHGTSEFELNMVLAEAPAGGLTGWLLYRDLFDRSTVERLVAQYRAMLTALADDSSAAIGSLARLVDGGWAREGALSPGQEA